MRAPFIMRLAEAALRLVDPVRVASEQHLFMWKVSQEWCRRVRQQLKSSEMLKCGWRV